MSLEWIIAGAGLGFMSSFHCVGMCGPLALSLPVNHLERNDQHIAIGLYHMGRIASYTLMGWIFGIAGRQFYLAGFQQTLSILTGILILFFSLRYYIWHRDTTPGFLSRFQLFIQRLMSNLLRSRSVLGFGLLGVANGFLPCSMVYLAIAGALTSQDTLQSMIFMASFGAATLPALLALTWMGQSINLSVRNRMKRWLPAFTIVVGIILILRGLNLGIPLISPIISSTQGTPVDCH